MAVLFEIPLAANSELSMYRFSEMPKFFSMSMMMFMIIYIYTTVRDTKVSPGSLFAKTTSLSIKKRILLNLIFYVLVCVYV